MNASTAFHCYVVADITQTLEDRIIGRFNHTPDGVGYFGYSADPPAFVEIVPYGKILADFEGTECGIFQDARNHERGLRQARRRIVANHFLETDLEKLKAAVSTGYARGRPLRITCPKPCPSPEPLSPCPCYRDWAA